MSIVHSPKTATDGLVFCCDALNLKKSWKGKTTTNLVTNPFCLNSGYPNITYSGYEATASLVAAFTKEMAAISPYWIKYVKSNSSNGRVWFLGSAGTGLTIETDYTYSAYIYTDDTRATSFSFETDNGAVSYTVSTPLTWSTTHIGTVRRVATVFKSTAGSNSHGCRIGATDPIGTTFYIAAWQLELGSFATPVVEGTRTNTQALVDVLGRQTVTANSLTYNSDGTFSFNGSTDYCTIATPLTGGVTTPFTLLAWAKSTNLSGWQTVIGTGGTYRQVGFSGTNFYWGGNGGGGNSLILGASGLSTNTWYHLAFTFDGVTGYGYFNGTQSSGSIGSNGGTIGSNYLGNYSAGELLTGSIGLAKIYNRALSAAEINQDYYAFKGRFAA